MLVESMLNVPIDILIDIRKSIAMWVVPIVNLDFECFDVSVE